jgi:hypothetical protein
MAERPQNHQIPHSPESLSGAVFHSSKQARSSKAGHIPAITIPANAAALRSFVG